MPLYLLDVNVLFALTWPNHLHHARARAWWGSVARWATTPVTESAFIRLSVNPAVVGRQVTVAEAVAVLRAIRSAPGHEFLADGSSFAAPGIDLTRVATARQITDAHLVNLAAAHDAVLATMDAGIADIVAPSDRHRLELLPQLPSTGR